MADNDNNSMQSQLGLVGQGNGSFNPLGISTPMPAPPPMVRHPGDISQDIVRQTQTAMATTLQTTSAMRLGGMGGMAFGGGGGVGAVGAFAQQYQQNMAGITSQYMNPMSAQMMGVMSGMGGGFQQGMMPNPAMMTSPGMGIYRPFPQGAGPSVSPMPQMPMFQHPLSPMPPPPQFQTPMELANNMSIQAGQRRTAAMFATPGVIARGATDVGLGYMGAGVGAALGARFGPMGAAIGGTLGMAAGTFGSEHFGLGRTAQHMTDNLNPFRTMAIRGQQMLAGSQDWVTGGTDLNMQTGRGLSQRGATHLGRMLEDTAFSSKFRRETGGAFSAQDLTKITNVAGQQGMLNDAQSVDQIHDRVKGVAKSLVSFMKIANEPNIVEALKSMGKMRAMGMSVGETMDMAMEARMYSKMSGQTVGGIMGGAGAQGAMLFQQQGLSAGLGMRMGMGAAGMAGAAVAGGAFSPQRLAMLGGASGVAQHEMESSAAFLKMPMMAAAMSRMGKGGEFVMDGSAVRSLGRGGMDINQMATRGVDNIMDAVRRQGVGALGMMAVQGTEIQDNIGRLLGPQGLQAAKMGQVMQTMKLMGLDKNPGGFATAGLSMGMSTDQVKSMMSQANSPGYFQNVQRQLSVQKMELRGLGQEEFERNRPGVMARVGEHFGGFRGVQDAYSGIRNLSESAVNFFAGDEQLSQARGRGQVVLRTERSLMGSDQQLRNVRAMRDPSGAAAALRGLSSPSLGSQLGRALRGAGDFITGGDVENRKQMREMEGGFGGLFSGSWGSAVETTARMVTGGRGFATESDVTASMRDKASGSAMWAAADREGGGARSERIAELVKGSGGDEKGMRSLIADVEMALIDDGKKAKNLLLPDEMAGGDATIAMIKEKAAARGMTLSDEQASSVGAASGKMAGMVSGNKKRFRGKIGVDVRSDKEFKEQLLDQQDSLTRAMYGSEGVMDVGRGTRDRRAALNVKLFGEQKDARAGTLASMMAAAAAPGASDAVKEQLRTALESEKDGDVRDRAGALFEGLGSADKADAAALGEKMSGISGSFEEKVAGMEGTREQSMVSQRALLERSGRRTLFGEEQGKKNLTTEELLAGPTEGMSEGMKAVAKRFRKARAKGEDTRDIVSEADELALDVGVTMQAETAGGTADASESAVAAEQERMAGTQREVGGAFPQAVETFSEASHALKRAAQLLGRTGDVTSMRNGGREE